MLGVRCTVTLLNDKNRTVDVEITKEKNGQFLWKVIKSSGGNLRLLANDGTWELFGNMMLIFWYETTGAERKRQPAGYTKLPTLVIHISQDSFFEDIVNNGRTIETKEDTLYNDNPAEKNVTCILTRMN